MSGTDNPLLAQDLPRFGDIRAEHAAPAIDLRLAEYQALLDELDTGAPDDPAAFIRREILADDALALVWSSIGHLHAVTNSAEWREAFSACLDKITAFYTARGHNRALFDVWSRAARASDFNDQSDAWRRMVEHELTDFRHSGVDLDPPQRDRFAEISMRQSRLGNQFGNHVLDATEQWYEDFDSAEALAGLPSTALDTLAEKARAADREGWRADLSYPCYRAIIIHADDRELRRRFYVAHSTRASGQGPHAGRHDNEPVVDEMLALRREEAALLGFVTPAELKLERRMAPDVATIEAFLRDLAHRARPSARRQIDELAEFARAHGGPDSLEPWDLAYWTEKMREATLGLSQEKLKPWFELERTLDALFDLAGTLFGVRIQRDENVAVWHPDVRFYRIATAPDQPAAGIYIDLYARNGKQGGAWMDVSRQRLGLSGAEPRAPIAYLTCNFAAPGRDDDGPRPSLLTHDDVVTLFHEFGHCLHHLLTEVDLPPVAGISGVEWDAVELPSQLLEGWTWAPEFLRRHARHFETGEALPEAWIEALDADRKFMGAPGLLRQIEFALTDMELHAEPGSEPVNIARRVHDEIAVMDMPDYNRYLMSFSHLFDGGYAAGYYSYLWAERLARDAFEMFREHGLTNRDCGERLRREILAVGGSRPMHESWIAFRGREPALDPLLEAWGIAA